MEIAAKMAMQYWSNIGEPRTKIASLKGGYHGDTFGSMSLGYVPDFFAPYKTKLFDVFAATITRHVSNGRSGY